MRITEEFENKIKNNVEVDNVDYIDSKKLLRKEIVDSNLSISSISTALGMNNYLYEILDMDNKKKYSRDRIIAILIYIKSDIETIQRILQGFGHSKIYVRVERDKIIYEGICKNNSLLEIENKLCENGFDTLSI